MDIRNLEGSIVALVTPFCADGSIDFAALERLVDFHLQNNTDVYKRQVKKVLQLSLVPSNLYRLVGLVILGLAIARQLKHHIGTTQTVDVVTGVVVGVNEEERHIAVGLILGVGDPDRSLGVPGLKGNAALGEMCIRDRSSPPTRSWCCATAAWPSRAGPKSCLLPAVSSPAWWASSASPPAGGCRDVSGLVPG